MALNQMLQTITNSMAKDSIRYLGIQADLMEASEQGPWRYSPDEVADMWTELTEGAKDLQRRFEAIRTVYDPTVARAIFEEMEQLVFDGVT